VKRSDYDAGDHGVDDENNKNLGFAEVKTKGTRDFLTHTVQTFERFR
jgi:hypothetical protein